ncbi:MAG: DNA polymerase III subunit delta, partial [Clostridiales bacterium]|nr:DNA polymerase III subunit delta [Clostridiales bacterium]
HLDEMKKAVLGDGPADFNLKKLDGGSLEINELREAVEAMPYFAERTYVEVRDYNIYGASQQDSEELAGILKDIPDYCCLVFVYDTIEFKADKRKKLHKLIEEKVKVVEIPIQKSSSLIGWISRRFAHNGKRISKGTAEFLIHYCGDLMTGLISEIEKISAYCQGEVVTREDIETVAIPVIDTAVFNLTNAISEKNYDRAARVLTELFQMGEPPIFILNIIGGQMRRLYAARLSYENGKNAKYLKALLGLRTDYQARLLMEAARRVSLNWCSDAVCLCAETDFRMKSTRLGEEELLISLLVSLAKN